ncbi:MAG: TGS domain-containing protein [Clostridium sp.]|nr:MAG: TGS domain-containing protein [Clostridium sp.]
MNANVYVYTPTGEVIDLQKGATPLDYAYKIHTNIGNKTVGAKVNNRIVPLDYELHTGDIVSILTSNTAAPNLDWLNIVRN